MPILKVLAFIIGLWIVYLTLLSAIRTFVLPRSARDPIAVFVYKYTRRIFDLRLLFAERFLERDRIRALLSPFSLITLLPVWLVAASLGYMLMFWAAGIESLFEAWTIAGSSLLTLGFAKGEGFAQTLLAFTASTLGLLLVALLIAYLPAMYAAFSKREVEVNLLTAAAGSPPSPVEILLRYNRLERLDELTALWQEWESWFAELEESHTSLSPLIFFRSPLPEHSWITAAGTVLDAAALSISAIEMPGSPEQQAIFRGQKVPADPRAALCIRMGFLALRRIADLFGIDYDPDPHFPENPISITREEFDRALAALEENGLPLKKDRETAWQDYGGWRVNYDTVLLALAELVMAPRAPWSSDRAPVQGGLPKAFKPWGKTREEEVRPLRG